MHWQTLILLVLGIHNGHSLGPKSFKFARLRSSLSANSVQGEVAVDLDLGEKSTGVSVRWSKTVPLRHYSVPIFSDSGNEVYQTDWYGVDGQHVTALYNIRPVLPQGRLNVTLTATNYEKTVTLKKALSLEVTLYPIEIEKDIDAIEPLEFPSGLTHIREGHSTTLTFKVKAKGELANAVHLGRIGSSTNRLLEYVSIRENESNDLGLEVSSESVDLDGGWREYSVKVRVSSFAAERHTARLNVEIMRAYAMQTAAAESVIFSTDLLPSSQGSLFAGRSLRMAVTACNPRNVNYDASPVEITMPRGLPNCVYCEAGGDPYPYAVDFYTRYHYPVASGIAHASYWYRKERGTLEGVYVVRAAMSTHAGLYSCESSSGNGRSSASTQFRILVQ